MGKKERERKWMAIFRIRSFYTWKASVFVKDETVLALYKIFEGFFFFPLMTYIFICTESIDYS